MTYHFVEFIQVDRFVVGFFKLLNLLVVTWPIHRHHSFHKHCISVLPLLYFICNHHYYC